MPLNRRHFCRHLCLMAAPAGLAGCTLQRLPALHGKPLSEPASAPTLRPPGVGQFWHYRQLNVFNSQAVGLLREAVDSEAPAVLKRQSGEGLGLPEERHSSWGLLQTEPVWDVPLLLEQPVPLWPLPLRQGSVTQVRTHYREPGGSYRYWVAVQARLLAWEEVEVTAGRFEVARVERMLELAHPDATRTHTRRTDVLWLAPQVGRWVARETSGHYVVPSGDNRGADVYLEDHFRWELTDWDRG